MKLNSPDNGFSLLEVLVSIALTGAIIALLLDVIPVGHSQLSKVRDSSDGIGIRLASHVKVQKFLFRAKALKDVAKFEATNNVLRLVPLAVSGKPERAIELSLLPKEDPAENILKQQVFAKRHYAQIEDAKFEFSEGVSSKMRWSSSWSKNGFPAMVRLIWRDKQSTNKPVILIWTLRDS